MLNRPVTRLNGATGPQPAGNREYDGRVLSAINGDNQAITLAAIIAGIVNRTGTTAATADTLPTVTSILAAMPELGRGDSISFSIRMALAHANTLTLGAGMTAVGTKDILASNIREYLLTITSEPKQTSTQMATTTNANAVLTNMSDAALQAVGVGMAVTGTGIGASAKVLAVNLTARTVTLDVNSTATADNVAVTFTPQADLLGVGTRAI